MQFRYILFTQKKIGSIFFSWRKMILKFWDFSFTSKFSKTLRGEVLNILYGIRILKCLLRAWRKQLIPAINTSQLIPNIPRFFHPKTIDFHHLEAFKTRFFGRFRGLLLDYHHQNPLLTQSEFLWMKFGWSKSLGSKIIIKYQRFFSLIKFRVPVPRY